jgi:hypothetical protein
MEKQDEGRLNKKEKKVEIGMRMDQEPETAKGMQEAGSQKIYRFPKRVARPGRWGQGLRARATADARYGTEEEEEETTS